MKKITRLAILGAAVMIAGGCARVSSSGINELNKRFFDAWIHTNYPNAPATELGAYILSDTPGTGALLSDEDTYPFAFCTFTQTDLYGNVSSTTDMITSQQIGDYSINNYYGPQVITRLEGYVSSGLSDVLSTMREGGERTVAIPGWLMTTSRYEDHKKYLEKESGSDAIVKISVKEAIADIVDWEIDSLSRYMANNWPGVDSTSYGYYYIQTKAPVDTTEFDDGESVFIDYTGRLLTGRVFDSSIEDTAKFYRFYSEGNTYEPSELTWATTDDITFESGSSMISGFEQCIRSMRTGEVGICIFYSVLGYSVSGSGSMIPPFSPLIFEIKMWGTDTDESNDLDSDTDSD